MGHVLLRCALVKSWAFHRHSSRRLNRVHQSLQVVGKASVFFGLVPLQPHDLLCRLGQVIGGGKLLQDSRCNGCSLIGVFALSVHFLGVKYYTLDRLLSLFAPNWVNTLG